MDTTSERSQPVILTPHGENEYVDEYYQCVLDLYVEVSNDKLPSEARVESLRQLLDRWRIFLVTKTEDIEYSHLVFTEFAELFAAISSTPNLTTMATAHAMCEIMCEWIETTSPVLSPLQRSYLAVAFLEPWGEEPRDRLAERWFGRWLVNPQHSWMAFMAFDNHERFPEILHELYRRVFSVQIEVGTSIAFPEEALYAYMAE
ncbi:hypothetical protein SH661x_000229 [Planctomicrobium sp. SH661]|uniref:hypothetical protein n=1 Tax=Planctomicrobium sp. SH661 TaxID=3448124 RepID=UPI003F5C4191